MPMTIAAIVERFRGLLVESWPIARLLPYIRNARTHSPEQLAQVAASIRRVRLDESYPGRRGRRGDRRPCAARWLPASLGSTEVPVIVLDHLTETDRRAYVLADNKLAENAGWDEAMLQVELQALAEEDYNLSLLGFSDEELQSALAGPEETNEGLTDEDAVPPEQERIVTVAGDVWIMGNHRCSVATRPRWTPSRRCWPAAWPTWSSPIRPTT